MNNKLRKITVEDKEYLYSIKEEYLPGGNNCMTIRLYLSGYKQTPFVVKFDTKDDFRLGQLLLKGIKLYNSQTQIIESVNLHHPHNIRKLILWAVGKGWNGSNLFPVQDGFKFLQTTGYHSYKLNNTDYKSAPAEE